MNYLRHDAHPDTEEREEWYGCADCQTEAANFLSMVKEQVESLQRSGLAEYPLDHVMYVEYDRKRYAVLVKVKVLL